MQINDVSGHAWQGAVPTSAQNKNLATASGHLKWRRACDVQCLNVWALSSLGSAPTISNAFFV